MPSIGSHDKSKSFLQIELQQFHFKAALPKQKQQLSLEKIILKLLNATPHVSTV